MTNEKAKEWYQKYVARPGVRERLRENSRRWRERHPAKSRESQRIWKKSLSPERMEELKRRNRDYHRRPDVKARRKAVREWTKKMAEKYRDEGVSGESFGQFKNRMKPFHPCP